MTVADIVGFIGYVPLMLGTFLLTTRLKRSAWLTRIVGDIILATAGVLGGLWSVVLISVSFAVMDIYGLWTSYPETYDPNAGPSACDSDNLDMSQFCECGRCKNG